MSIRPVRPLSLTGEYHVVWSGDPALDAPPRPAEDAKDGDPVLATWNEWQNRLKVARQTGTKDAWMAVLKPAQIPTLFRLRQIPTTIAGRLLAIARTGDLDPLTELPALAFRVALVGIEQWAPGVEFTFKVATDATYPKLGQIAEEKVVDALTLHVMAEIGTFILHRCQEADPLS